MVVWYVTGRLESMLDAHRRAALLVRVRVRAHPNPNLNPNPNPKPVPRRAAIEHYLRVHQQTDGGWAARVELLPSCHSSPRASRGAGSGQAPPGLLAWPREAPARVASSAGRRCREI